MSSFFPKPVSRRSSSGESSSASSGNGGNGGHSGKRSGDGGKPAQSRFQRDDNRGRPSRDSHPAGREQRSDRGGRSDRDSRDARNNEGRGARNNEGRGAGYGAGRPQRGYGPKKYDNKENTRPAPYKERRGGNAREESQGFSSERDKAIAPNENFSSRHEQHEDEIAPMLPGIKPVLELLESTPERVDAVFLRKGRHSKEMDSIVDLCRNAGVRFSLLEGPSFARVYSGNSQGVVARLFSAGFVTTDELFDGLMDAPLPLIVALDQVQDPGNAGTLARTLYALGGAGMVVPRHNGVYLGAAAGKAAAGALEKLPVAKAGNLGQMIDAARKQGITIYGAASASSTEESANIPVVDVFSVAPRIPAVLVLGSEEDGMRQSMEKRCDFLVRIPMLRDFDSLNVAQAGGIIVSWFANAVQQKK